jgi:transcriptional regulator with XRE-family HTH domain
MVVATFRGSDLCEARGEAGNDLRGHAIRTRPSVSFFRWDQLIRILPSRPGPHAGVGALIRHWRTTRRLSQLELALNADVSSRHLSYVETGRSQPGREMVLRLVNWEETAGDLIRHLHNQIAGSPSDERAKDLLAEVLAYPDIPARSPRRGRRNASVSCVSRPGHAARRRVPVDEERDLLESPQPRAPAWWSEA